MSTKELSSLQFNGITWSIASLGAKVILLEAPKEIAIDKIHESTHAIETILGDELQDIVPAYHSIALFSNLQVSDLLKRLAMAKAEENVKKRARTQVEIPICYELGPDLNEVSRHTGLLREDVIQIHLSGNYRSLFIGFTPGFIYADGLDPRLACPRKSNPRQRLPAGSVGIGGDQTGIYSLESPGGWNIIGRTPLKLFDMNNNPPMLIEVGTHYTFKRITEKAFEAWGS